MSEDDPEEEEPEELEELVAVTSGGNDESVQDEQESVREKHASESEPSANVASTSTTPGVHSSTVSHATGMTSASAEMAEELLEVEDDEVKPGATARSGKDEAVSESDDEEPAANRVLKEKSECSA